MYNQKQDQLRKACEDFMDKVREIAGVDWHESRTNVNISIHSLPDDCFTSDAKVLKDPDFNKKVWTVTKSEPLIKNCVHIFSKATVEKELSE